MNISKKRNTVHAEVRMKLDSIVPKGQHRMCLNFFAATGVFLCVSFLCSRQEFAKAIWEMYQLQVIFGWVSCCQTCSLLNPENENSCFLWAKKPHTFNFAFLKNYTVENTEIKLECRETLQ